MSNTRGARPTRDCLLRPCATVDNKKSNIIEANQVKDHLIAAAATTVLVKQHQHRRGDLCMPFAPAATYRRYVSFPQEFHSCLIAGDCYPAENLSRCELGDTVAAFQTDRRVLDRDAMKTVVDPFPVRPHHYDP
jgi:hypothetical protein